MNPSRAARAKPFLAPESDLPKPGSRVITIIAGLYLLLTILGLMNLYSASMGEPFFYSQMQHAAVAAVAFGVMGWLFPLRLLDDYCYWIYGVLCAMLVAVLFTGHIAHGSQRWLHFGPVTVQPSELMKLGVVLVVAHYFHHNPLAGVYRLRDLWRVGLLVGLPFLLIFEQPDLGTAGVCVLIVTCQIAFIRLDFRSIAIVALSGIVVAALGWFIFLHDYQRTRVLTLLNPDVDPTGSGYNSLQSLVAIGSGMLTGKGFLQGTQTQLQFLPARHTDFIFSVFAEEHGFWACCILFAIYGILTICSLEVARYARDTFSSLVAIGCGAVTFIHFMINIAMVLGMFPVVGVPLPLFSQGGSSLLTTSVAIGLLVAVHRTSMSRRRS